MSEAYRKSNFNVSISNFGTNIIIYDGIFCFKTPFKGFAPINKVKELLFHIRYNIAHRYEECAEHGK